MLAKTQLIRKDAGGARHRRGDAVPRGGGPGGLRDVIKNVLDLEKGLLELLRTRYLSAPEVIKGWEAEDEFGRERETIRVRSRRYREAIERIEGLVPERTAALASAVDRSAAMTPGPVPVV
jgi:hypothetical protein